MIQSAFKNLLTRVDEFESGKWYSNIVILHAK